MLSELPQRYVCNNCACTKAGEECEDCTMHGCQCTCQAVAAPLSEEAPTTCQQARKALEPSLQADATADGSLAAVEQAGSKSAAFSEEAARREFEEWGNAKGAHIEQTWNGEGYDNKMVDTAWQGWLACAKKRTGQ